MLYHVEEECQALCKPTRKSFCGMECEVGTTIWPSLFDALSKRQDGDRICPECLDEWIRRQDRDAENSHWRWKALDVLREDQRAEGTE